jgi:pimeloyl-ACP methyl ester carboxylesterase
VKVALLVHGNASSSRVWGRIVEGYEARGVRSVVPDLPGFGARPEDRVIRRPGQDALDPYVDAALAALAAEPGGDLDDVLLHGAGIGALVAVRAALRLSSRAAAVALHGPVFRHGSGHGAFAWMTRTTPGAALALNLAHGPAARIQYLADQLGPPPYDEAELDRVLTDLYRTPARSFAAYQRASLPPAEALRGARALRCPVTVLWGIGDGVLAPAAAAGELLAHLPPQTTLIVQPTSRHAP